MTTKRLIATVALSGLLLLQCGQSREKTLTPAEIHETEEALITANRMLLKKDKEKIQQYIADQNLSLTETESGLWYGIIRQGEGPVVKEGMLVTLSYKVSLLDGTVCYSSAEKGVKQFITGKGGVESGLEEGVLLLQEGSKAVFIMPPHLAHGLTGDGDKIPARSIIVYEVELIKAES
jgi:FKBP-type peptidyl-prolyl cis-trans isomerase FkpA